MTYFILHRRTMSRTNPSDNITLEQAIQSLHTEQPPLPQHLMRRSANRIPIDRNFSEIQIISNTESAPIDTPTVEIPTTINNLQPSSSNTVLTSSHNTNFDNQLSGIAQYSNQLIQNLLQSNPQGRVAPQIENNPYTVNSS